MRKPKEPKEPREPGKVTQITVHLPIEKEMDSYLTILAERQERSKVQQIRFILNEYKRKNPLEESK